MAKLSFYKIFDFRDGFSFSGLAEKRTSKKFILDGVSTDEDHRGIYRGDFDYEGKSARFPSGSLKSFKQKQDGSTAIEAEKLDLSAKKFFKLHDRDDPKNLVDYVLRGSDKIILSSADDLARGGKSDDKIKGMSGNDSLFGETGKDKIYGGGGDDRLAGGGGNDKLKGGSGDDTIVGGRKADKLWGGSGADEFVFESVKDSGSGSDRRDFVRDFFQGEDSIDLSSIDANPSKGGNQSFTFAGSDGLSGKRGELVFKHLDSKNVTLVRGDTDGDGKADLEIKFSGRIDFVASDFSGVVRPSTPKPSDPAPDSDPTPDPAPNSPAENFDFFAFAGQSNSAGHFFRRSGDDSGGKLGNDVFEDTMQRLSGVKIKAINAAESGSGSNEFADPVKYWWDYESDKPGPSLVKAIRAIERAIPSGRDLDGIVWAQGEDDRSRMERGEATKTVVSQMKYSTTKVFETLRDESGDVPIFIQELGEFAPRNAMNALRTGQDQLISELTYVYDGASTAGVDHGDDIHFSNKGYGEIAEDLAHTAYDVLSDEFDFG